MNFSCLTTGLDFLALSVDLLGILCQYKGAQRPEGEDTTEINVTDIHKFLYSSMLRWFSNLKNLTKNFKIKKIEFFIIIDIFNCLGPELFSCLEESPSRREVHPEWKLVNRIIYFSIQNDEVCHPPFIAFL